MAENSGGSCSYYEVDVKCPIKLEPYRAECGDIIVALHLNTVEAEIFKEIWRRSAARKGKEKEGNTPLRGAKKIMFSAERLLQLEEFWANDK